MAPVEVDPNMVCVNFARPVCSCEKGYFETLTTLSDEEIHRAERFHFEPDRRLFVASRALVRRVLSRYSNVESSAWRFDTNSYGRPYITFPTEGRMFRFSVSHTDGLVMCAVTFNRDVGVDVECLRECPLDIVESFFKPAEAQSIREERSRSEQSDRFFAHWTLKESYSKARGFGLSIPFDKFSFQLSDNRPPRLEIDPMLDDRFLGWRFCLLRPTQTHRAALCVYLPDQPTVSILPSWG